MKRITLALFVASVALLLFSIANLSPGPIAAPEPKTVEVVGTVSVDNFPAQQEVFGVVNIGNLPSAKVQFVGFSSPVSLFPPNSLTGSRVCSDEIPGTRLCFTEEFFESIPAPPLFSVQMGGTGLVRFMRRDESPGSVPTLICLRDDGELEASACTTVPGLTETPFACCG